MSHNQGKLFLQSFMSVLHRLIRISDGDPDEDKSQFQPPSDDEMVKFTADDTVNVAPETPQEEVIDEGEELYREAMTLLNSSSLINRQKAWEMMDEAAALKHLQAKVKIGWARLGGISSFKQQPSEAKKVFDEGAGLGDPEAQMGLGLLHATGTMVNSSQAEALLYYTFGAFGGSHWAQMALGYR